MTRPNIVLIGNYARQTAVTRWCQIVTRIQLDVDYTHSSLYCFLYPARSSVTVPSFTWVEDMSFEEVKETVGRRVPVYPALCLSLNAGRLYMVYQSNKKETQ